MLDGYRGVAALLVVTTHVAFSTAFAVGGSLGAVAARFDIGVAIFFLLSGFLLYRGWARSGLTGARVPGSRVFYRRRLWRILPAYWVMVLAVLFLLPTIEPTLYQSLGPVNDVCASRLSWPWRCLTGEGKNGDPIDQAARR